MGEAMTTTICDCCGERPADEMAGQPLCAICRQEGDTAEVVPTTNRVGLMVSALIRCAERLGYRVEHISEAGTGSTYITFSVLATEDRGDNVWDWCTFPDPIIRVADHGDAHGNCHISVSPEDCTLRQAIRFLRRYEITNQEHGTAKLVIPLRELRQRDNVQF